MKHRSTLLPLLLALNACGGGSAEPAKPAATPALENPAPTYVLPGNGEIAARVYDPDYSVPGGFFTDARAGTSASYTVHHVMDSSGSYELCTDDFATAEAWEAADNASRSVSGYFVGAVETERYFEFVRELNYTSDVGNVGSPTSPGYARVFKCSNTNRDGVDRSDLNGYAGMLNVTPRSAEDVRVFAEYLWQFAFFPYRHRKVLDSVGTATATGFDRSLILGFAVNQGDGRCDRIDVVEWSFAVDRDSGRIEQRFETVRSFEARLESGSPVLCD